MLFGSNEIEKMQQFRNIDERVNLDDLSPLLLNQMSNSSQGAIEDSLEVLPASM